MKVISYLRASPLSTIIVILVLLSLWLVSININSARQDEASTKQANLLLNFQSIYEDQIVDDELSQEEKYKEFNISIRTHVIYGIIFCLLYLLSLYIISRYSKLRDTEFEFDFEERQIYKISSWTCAFTLAISFAALLLLPISITTNEITWIADQQTKRTLLNGLWGYVFLFSNISLFVLLPFAYFFTESEGFSGSRRGIMSRLRETFVLLIIVGILLLGMTYILICFLSSVGCNIKKIFNMWQYLPFLFSCISFIGALLLLLCTPVGISNIFTVSHSNFRQSKEFYYLSTTILVILTGSSVIIAFYNTVQLLTGYKPLPITADIRIDDPTSRNPTPISDHLKMMKSDQSHIQQRKTNGSLAALLEIILILYLWCTCMCGLYNLPWFSNLRPRLKRTSFNQIIGNCAVLCLLSSALPVFSRILGMTNFDLLEDYGRIVWLGDFFVVLLFNLFFFIFTTLCLFVKLKQMRLKPMMVNYQETQVNHDKVIKELEELTFQGKFEKNKIKVS